MISDSYEMSVNPNAEQQATKSNPKAVDGLKIPRKQAAQNGRIYFLYKLFVSINEFFIVAM